MIFETFIPNMEDVPYIEMNYYDYIENENEIQEQLISEYGHSWIWLHLKNY